MKKIVSASLVLIVIFLAASCASVKTEQAQAPAAQGVDLVLTGFKVVADKVFPSEGAGFAFEFKVKNIGTAAVPDMKDANVLSLPRVMVYLKNDMFAMSQPIPAMKPGEEVTLTTEVMKDGVFPPVPGKVSLPKAGDYSFTATIDPAGFIQETSTANNSMSTSTSVAPKAK